MAVTTKNFRMTTSYESDQRQAIISLNRVMQALQNTSYGPANFAINSNFDIKNSNAVQCVIAGISQQLAASTNFDTGTAATITSAKWGIAMLSWDGTTATVKWQATATAMAYASEAAAIAALGTAPLIPASGFAPLGYVTVLAGAALWTAGTDALAGGTGGTPATTTNYYNDPSLNGTVGPALATLIANMSGTVVTA